MWFFFSVRLCVQHCWHIHSLCLSGHILLLCIQTPESILYFVYFTEKFSLSILVRLLCLYAPTSFYYFYTFTISMKTLNHLHQLVFIWESIKYLLLFALSYLLWVKGLMQHLNLSFDFHLQAPCSYTQTYAQYKWNTLTLVITFINI